jgi:hypothetical protein
MKLEDLHPVDLCGEMALDSGHFRVPVTQRDYSTWLMTN